MIIQDKINLLYHRFPSAIMGNITLTAALTPILYFEIGSTPALAWFVLNLLQGCYRFYTYHAFLHRANDNNPRRWISYAYLGVIFSGSLWSVVSGVWVGNVSPDAHVLLCMTIIGVSAISTVFFASLPLMNATFVALLLIPLAINFASYGTTIKYMLAVFIVLYFFMILNTIRRLCDDISRTLALQNALKKNNVELTTALTALDEQHKELGHMQAKIVQAEKMSGLGTMVAGVAHEINNPINFVYVGASNASLAVTDLEAFIYNALDETDTESQQLFQRRFETIHNQLRAVQEGADRTKRIINDLQLFSHINTRYDKESVPLDECIRASLQIIRSRYSQHVNLIADDLPDITVKGVSAKISQVFLNLAINACHAIVQRQQQENNNARLDLRITLNQEDNWAVIRFADSGCGIAEADLGKIFEPFFTTKDVGQGTGLGLAICFGIIKEHKGRIEVSSTVGQGTTFSVYLPIAQ